MIGPAQACHNTSDSPAGGSAITPQPSSASCSRRSSSPAGWLRTLSGTIATRRERASPCTAHLRPGHHSLHLLELGRLVVVEQVLPDADHPHPCDTLAEQFE